MAAIYDKALAEMENASKIIKLAGNDTSRTTLIAMRAAYDIEMLKSSKKISDAEKSQLDSKISSDSGLPQQGEVYVPLFPYAESVK